MVDQVYQQILTNHYVHLGATKKGKKENDKYFKRLYNLF